MTFSIHDDYHLFALMTFIIYVVNRVGDGSKGAMMRVSRQQTEANRDAILSAAARLFRERGFDGVTVAEVMRDAGLTHGGFYGHFASKDDLAAKALEHVLGSPRSNEAKPVAEVAARYLTPVHRESPGTGCPFAALGTEAARAVPAIRHAMTEGLQRKVEGSAAAMRNGSEAERRRAALAAWSTMVGALMLSRLVDDETMSDEILEAAADAVG